MKQNKTVIFGILLVVIFILLFTSQKKEADMTCSDFQNIGINQILNLENDIDCTGFNFVSIGTQAIPFNGQVNGNNHRITGVTLVGNGIFGYTGFEIYGGRTMKTKAYTGMRK